MSWIIKQKKVLELGAGLGLSGLTVSKLAQSVCFTDFNDTVIDNLRYNVALNSGSSLIDGISAVGMNCDMEVSESYATLFLSPIAFTNRPIGVEARLL